MCEFELNERGDMCMEFHQSQVQKPIGSEVKWFEFSLIIGTGCWVQVFSLILDSWVGIQSTGEMVSETSQLRILHSAEEDNLSPFDSKIVLPMPEPRN